MLIPRCLRKSDLLPSYFLLLPTYLLKIQNWIQETETGKFSFPRWKQRVPGKGQEKVPFSLLLLKSSYVGPEALGCPNPTASREPIAESSPVASSPPTRKYFSNLWPKAYSLFSSRRHSQGMRRKVTQDKFSPAFLSHSLRILSLYSYQGIYDVSTLFNVGTAVSRLLSSNWTNTGVYFQLLFAGHSMSLSHPWCHPRP